ncbi:MAG: ribosomal protein L40E [Glaciecola sp.]
MNCPECNAHNPERATFCSLCHTNFAAPAAVEFEAPLPPDAGPPTSGASATALHDRFRKTDGGFDWRCERCQQWSPLQATTCRVCSQPFREAFAEQKPPPIPDASDAMVLALTALLPGLGHIATGRTGIGVSRLMLYLVFALGAAMLQLQAAQTTASAVAVIPLALGALVVWISTMLDARSVTLGSERTVLPSRAYLWLLVAVFVLTLGSAMPAVLRATR